jgi:hypothetical protein
MGGTQRDAPDRFYWIHPCLDEGPADVVEVPPAGQVVREDVVGAKYQVVGVRNTAESPDELLRVKDVGASELHVEPQPQLLKHGLDGEVLVVRLGTAYDVGVELQPCQEGRVAVYDDTVLCPDPEDLHHLVFSLQDGGVVHDLAQPPDAGPAEHLFDVLGGQLGASGDRV